MDTKSRKLSRKDVKVIAPDGKLKSRQEAVSEWKKYMEIVLSPYKEVTNEN